MENGFKKFRSKFHKEALVKIVTGGVAFGLLTLGVLLLILRLQGLVLLPLAGVAIGLGATLLAAGVLFFLLYESEKRLARKLDNTLQLDERVQTMTEYKDLDGDMVALQRRTTEEKLSKLPAKFSWKNVWRYVLALGLAVGVFVAAVFVPVRSQIEDDPPVVTEKPFALTEYHRLAMENLVAEVQASEAAEVEKTAIVSALNELLDRLENVDKQKRMKELVAETMLAVDDVADRENTCDDLYPLFNASEFAVMDDFAVLIATTDVQVMTQNIAEFRANFQNEEENAQTVSETLNTFVGSATGALTLASTTLSDDPLYLATKAIVDKYASIAQNAPSDYGELNAALETGISETKAGLELALDQQFKNREISDRTIDRLQMIFELTDLDVPDFDNDWLTGPVDNEQGSDQKDEGLNSGGLPEGDKHYASDDEIFDPDTGTYVPYGEVITEYQKYINEIAASLPEDLREYYNAYFQTLRGAADEE